jgi:hypothetical protein
MPVYIYVSSVSKHGLAAAMQQSILLLHAQQALTSRKSGVQYSIMSIKLIEVAAAAAAKISMLHFSQLT